MVGNADFVTVLMAAKPAPAYIAVLMRPMMLKYIALFDLRGFVEMWFVTDE